jgi:hypothetical protein
LIHVQAIPQMPYMTNCPPGRQTSLNQHEHASTAMMNGVQNGQIFVRPSMLHDRLADGRTGAAPGPMHNRASVPVHRTVGPYMIPSGHDNYMMEKQMNLSVNKQVWKVISVVITDKPSFGAVSCSFHSVIDKSVCLY